MHLASGNKTTGAIGPKGQDEQRGIAISPALGQRLFKRAVGIQPDDVLIAQLHDIGNGHHLTQPLTIAVPVTDKGRAYVGIKGCEDGVGLAVFEMLFPSLGIIPVNERHAANMKDRCFSRHCAGQSLGVYLTFGCAVAVKAVGWHPVGINRHHRKRGGLLYARAGDVDMALKQAVTQEIAKSIR